MKNKYGIGFFAAAIILMLVLTGAYQLPERLSNIRLWAVSGRMHPAEENLQAGIRWRNCWRSG